MWVVFALLTSVIKALYFLCNQNCKLKADIFIIYRGFFLALLATPFTLLHFHIFPWQFYAIVLFQGLLLSYSDYRYFQMFQKFSARNVNAVAPLGVLVIFILWLILKPETIKTYLQTPMRSCVIVLSIILIIYSVIKYRNYKIGRDCMKEMLPLLLMSSLINISNKIITEYSEGYLLALTINRVALTGWIIGFINLFRNYKKIDYKELIKPKNLCQGWFIFLAVFSMITINFAMHYTPNPAYVTSTLFMSIIWIVIINKIGNLIGIKTRYDNINLKWIVLLIFATSTLIIATH